MRLDLVSQMGDEVRGLVDAALVEAYIPRPYSSRPDTCAGQKYDRVMFLVRHMAEEADCHPDDGPADGQFWSRVTLALHLKTMCSDSGDEIARVLAVGFGDERTLSVALSEIVKGAPRGKLAAAMEYARWCIVALVAGIE